MELILHCFMYCCTVLFLFFLQCIILYTFLNCLAKTCKGTTISGTVTEYLCVFCSSFRKGFREMYFYFWKLHSLQFFHRLCDCIHWKISTKLCIVLSLKCPMTCWRIVILAYLLFSLKYHLVSLLLASCIAILCFTTRLQ